MGVSDIHIFLGVRGGGKGLRGRRGARQENCKREIVRGGKT
jgi:hypothetical protein